MNVSTERFDLGSRVPSWVRYEHEARYAFVSGYVKSKRVVDAACGVGLGSAVFAKAGAAFVEAFDLSESAIQEAGSRFNCQNLRFRQADCLRLPLPNQSADLFVALETIEHLDKDLAFLQEAARLLKPEGLFICSTPNRTITNPGAALTDKPRNCCHPREYARLEFTGLLERSFGQIKLFGQNPQRPWKTALLNKASGYLPKWIAVRLSLLFKIPRLWRDCYEAHRVQPVSPQLEYEYWIAVCSEPLRWSSLAPTLDGASAESLR